MHPVLGSPTAKEALNRGRGGKTFVLTTEGRVALIDARVSRRELLLGLTPPLGRIRGRSRPRRELDRLHIARALTRREQALSPPGLEDVEITETTAPRPARFGLDTGKGHGERRRRART